MGNSIFKSYNYKNQIQSFEDELTKLEQEFFICVNNRDWTVAESTKKRMVYVNTFKHNLYFWDELDLEPYGAGTRILPPQITDVIEHAQSQNQLLQVSATPFRGSELTSGPTLQISNPEQLIPVLSGLMEALTILNPTVYPTSKIYDLAIARHTKGIELRTPSLNELISMAAHQRFRLTFSILATD